ncbi:MAG: hypothetical protein A3J63_01585 [Candidatus Moranbacteria bacterium RIFCSPHIGHO2_02_FULL_40_12b]|nr:MAG: hypothetical protein A3J63_01585 [Candidatus Moranbacteria bacterium RIFCSPHIGHO2_02_FULL_40_12b]
MPVSGRSCLKKFQKGNKMKIKYVITDVDGVLIDRMPIYKKAFQSVVTDFGVPKKDAGKYYYDTAGTPIEKQISGILRKWKANSAEFLVDDLVIKFFKIASVHPHPPLFIGVKKTVKKLKGLGKFLCATSGSKTAELEELFKRNSLQYDVILGSDKIPKGDEHIKFFARHFHIPKNKFCAKALYLGDGPQDMRIASANKVMEVGITNTVSAEKLLKAGAKKIIRNIEEVLEFME